MTISTSSGNLAVNGTISANTSVSLTSSTGAITTSSGSINANTLSLSAATGIDLDTTINTLTSANVTGTGNLNVRNTSGMTVTSATTANGSVTLQTANGTTLSVASATAGSSGTMTLTAGEINTTAAGLTTSGSGNLTLHALTGDIGASGNRVKVSVGGNLLLTTDAATGNAYITSAALLKLGTITTNGNLTQTVDVQTTGTANMTAAASSTTSETVTLSSAGTFVVNDSVTLFSRRSERDGCEVDRWSHVEHGRADDNDRRHEPDDDRDSLQSDHRYEQQVPECCRRWRGAEFEYRCGQRGG